MKTRREWLRAACGSLSLLLHSVVKVAAGQVTAFDPKQFQIGDFLSPKKPGVFVPYDAKLPRGASFVNVWRPVQEARRLGQLQRSTVSA